MNKLITINFYSKLIEMNKSKGDEIVIKFDANKLPDKRSKADFLFKLLKESNPLSKNSHKLTINDLLLNELQFYLQQKQSVCSKKTS
jgi:hypothetical protein